MKRLPTSAELCMLGAGLTPEQVAKKARYKSVAYVRRLLRNGGCSWVAAKRLSKAIGCRMDVFCFRTPLKRPDGSVINRAATRPTKKV